MRRRDDDLTAWQDEPLVRALTSPGTADELAGVEPVLQAFRTQASSRRRRRRLAGHLGAGVTTVIAAMSLSGGVAAAYTSSLPSPVQHVVHEIFRPLGVPDSSSVASADAARDAQGQSHDHHHDSGDVSTGRPFGPAAKLSPNAGAPGPGGMTSLRPALSASAPPSSSVVATPSASATPAQLAVNTSRVRVAIDHRAVLTGTLTTASGEPVANHRVAMFERVGDGPWQRLSDNRTGTDGTVRIASPPLTRNVSLRLVTPQHLASGIVTVIVIPKLTVTLSQSADGASYLTSVSCPGGHDGDIVTLQKWQGGAWVRVARHQLDADDQTHFTIKRPTAGQVAYRVVLSATSSHGATNFRFAVAAAGG